MRSVSSQGGVTAPTADPFSELASGAVSESGVKEGSDDVAESVCAALSTFSSIVDFSPALGSIGDSIEFSDAGNSIVCRTSSIGLCGSDGSIDLDILEDFLPSGLARKLCMRSGMDDVEAELHLVISLADAVCSEPVVSLDFLRYRSERPEDDLEEPLSSGSDSDSSAKSARKS